jgi:hypothetical protein
MNYFFINSSRQINEKKGQIYLLFICVLLVLIEFASFLGRNVSLGLRLATNITLGFHPPSPHSYLDSPLQSKIFSFENFLVNLKIRFKDPKFWIK